MTEERTQDGLEKEGKEENATRERQALLFLRPRYFASVLTSKNTTGKKIK